MQAFHGTNEALPMIAVGSWIPLDREAALDFALEKVAQAGGSPVVIEIDIREKDVDWDVISGLCGVEDERGTLLVQVLVASASGPAATTAASVPPRHWGRTDLGFPKIVPLARNGWPIADCFKVGGASCGIQREKGQTSLDR